MDRQQLTVLRQTIEELKRAAREDYERRVEKLDAALAVAEEMTLRAQRVETGEPLSPEDDAILATIIPPQDLMGEESSASNGTKPFVLKDEVRQTVRSWRGHAFRQRDITGRIRARHGRHVHAGSVSSALKKMVARGEIEVVRESRGGSEPTIYREIAVSP